MTATYFLYRGDYHELGEDAELPEDAEVVPRLPGPGETWDPVAQEFVCDAEMVVRLQQFELEVREAHVIKRVEAALVSSGYLLTAGLLFSESKATGQPLSELAAEVLAAADEATAREVGRRKAIAAARNRSYGKTATPKEKK